MATPRQTTADALPSRGLGLDVGGHVYPFRWKGMTFGFGADVHWSRGSSTPDTTTSGSNAPAANPITVQTRFTAIAPQVSLNFGHRMGWSYIGGGLGRATYKAWREDLVAEDGQGTRAINVGGGARWFLNDHVALSLDLRFHMLNAVAASTGVAGHPSMKVTVGNIGVSIR